MSRVERRVLAALMTGFAAVYITYGLFRHWHFYTSFDLAIFDQAVWHLARFERPASSIKDMANLFGDHFHPIIVLFAPAYWIVAAPETLIVLQGALLAAAILPIFLFLRRRLEAGPALALCAAYGFFWGVQHAAAHDVHEFAFAPVAIACAVLTMDRKQWPAFWVAIVAVMLVKEDLIPLAGFFGLYLALIGHRRQGVLLMGASTLGFAIVMRWLIPWLQGAPYTYAGLYASLLDEPWRIPVALVTPPDKLMAVLLWVAPFVFLPLGSPLLVLLVPLALVRLLPDNSSYWGISFHYAAPLAPILVMSAGDGLGRLSRRLRAAPRKGRWQAWAAGLSVLFSAILPGNQPFWDLFSFEHFRPTADQRVWADVAPLIPNDASVVAQAALLPHLSHRQELYLLREGARDADLLVAAYGLSPWPEANHDALAAIIDARKRAGYRPIFERDGWVLLERTSPATDVR